MYKNNSPPEIKSMCGIDSLHIQVRCSIAELFSFIREEELMIIEECQTKWTTKLKIILVGEKIQVVTTKRGLCRLEFGGLYYSENSVKKLQLVRNLTRVFPDFKIQRLDFACDLKVPFEDIGVALPKQCDLYDRYRDSFYINRKTKQRTLSWIVYDKAKRMKLFSFPLTRIELRLFKGSINNRKLANCFNDADVFDKASNLIDKHFSSLEITIKGQAPDGFQVNARTVLENFVEFLHGGDSDYPKQRDHFHMSEALVARDKIKQWMETETISWKDLPVHCKKVQKNVCEKVGISEPTLRKAIRYAKKL